MTWSLAAPSPVSANRRMTRALGVLLLPCSLICFLEASAASFDCAKASSQVEKTICSDPELSKLDEELGATYEAALRNAPQTVAQLRREQRRWLKIRDDQISSGPDKLKALYQTRIAALTAKAQADARGDIDPSAASFGMDFTTSADVDDLLPCLFTTKGELSNYVFQASPLRALARIDGKLHWLQLRSSYWQPSAHEILDPDDVIVAEYADAEVRVLLRAVASSVCRPDEDSCTIWFNHVALSVTKGGLSKTIDAHGFCDSQGMPVNQRSHRESKP